MSTATSGPTTMRPVAVRLKDLQFPQRCISCGNPPQTSVHVVGRSRREWKVLSAIFASGVVVMAGYSLTYERPQYAALGLLNILGELSFSYLLFYWVLLAPALALYRLMRRTRGTLAATLGAVPAGVLWLCMAAYGPISADGDDTIQTIGLLSGFFLTALFIVHVNSRLHLYLPVCTACRKAAADSVRITDYSPWKGQADLQFQNRDYAQALAQVNHQGTE